MKSSSPVNSDNLPLALCGYSITANLPLIAFLALLSFMLPPATAAFASAQTNSSPPHKITYDSYSLMIDGKRIFLYSGEIHLFRLPSPSLWLDVLEPLLRPIQ
jgi:Glycosyl hydrolases family 35